MSSSLLPLVLLRTTASFYVGGIAVVGLAALAALCGMLFDVAESRLLDLLLTLPF